MKLYIYEHCPYCIRVKMVLGLKKINCDLVYIQDDDIDTPTKMIGKKVVPILEPKTGQYLAESLDLVDYLDRLDQSPILQKSTTREDLDFLFKKYYSPIRELFFTYSLESNFPELSTESAKRYFINRFMKKFPYENPSQIKENDQKNRVAIKSFLAEVAALIHSSDSISSVGFGYDDVIFFPMLHGLTVVPNLQWDKFSKEYLDNIMKKTQISPFVENFAG